MTSRVAQSRLYSVQLQLIQQQRLQLLNRFYTTTRRLAKKSNNTTNTTVWERQAQLVKKIEVTNPYLDAMRQTHDPRMQLKTLEDELQGAIGAALGRQGHKLVRKLQLMAEQYDKYEQLLQQQQQDSSNNSNDLKDQLKNAAQVYNDYRRDALQARWELQVHRQAAGFIVQNHQYVTKSYPIPDALPVTDDNNNAVEEEPKKKQQQFGDQLDWWQRIGRWR